MSKTLSKSTYAVVETGGKQYVVAKGTALSVERLGKKVGSEVTLSKVLAVRDGKDFKVGKPHLKGAKVLCKVTGEARGKKVLSFKFKRRKGYQKAKGHRQWSTQLEVTKVEV